ncbi:MAG: dihydroorotase [Actinomycetota bacterium]
MTVTVITGGTILDQSGRRDADVAVDNASGLIVGVGSGLDGDETLDASGCVVSPAFVDLDVHVREPGFEGAATALETSRGAALGGFGAIVAMPDTDPCADEAAVLTDVARRSGGGLAAIVPAAALTARRAGTGLAPLGELAEAGARIFTDGDRRITDGGIARRVLEYLRSVEDAAGVELVAAQPPLRPDLDGAGVMHEGMWSAGMGLPGAPSLAEELAVAELIGLSRITGAAIHIQQVSTAAAVAAIDAAKADGVRVTAEVSPHHLTLVDEAASGYDPNVKLRPPLRPAPDREALVDGLRRGVIDAVATRHAPWPADAKEQPFADAPFGALGLETAVASILTLTDLTIDEIVPALSWGPAAIAGLGADHGTPIVVDRPANLAVIDPAESWTVERASFGGHAANSPFLGRELTGRVRHTIHRGDAVVVNAKAVR